MIRAPRPVLPATEKVELGGERVGGEALVEFTSSFQFRSKNPSFLGPVRRRPIVWEDPERGGMSRAKANAIAAPVFEIALGNASSGLSQYSKGWILAHRHWSGRLLQDPAFARRLADRWRELRAAGLRGDVMRAIDDSQAALRGSVGRNFRRWPILHTPVWPSKRAHGSHRAEVRFLRLWMSRRIAWMDGGLEQ